MRAEKDLVGDRQDLPLSVPAKEDRTMLSILWMCSDPGVPTLQMGLQVHAHPHQVQVPLQQ